MFQKYEIATRPENGPPRLKALRGAMKDARVQAFLIPRSDAHRGENVAPADERLAWLTGFTGSAGIAIATRNHAAIFVDGRYTLQVRDQVATDHFEARNIPDDEPGDYLADQLAKGDVVAYDPWLHTRNGLKELRKKLDPAGIKLRASPNLVDQVWADRPAPLLAPARVHPVDLAGEAHGDKIARLADDLTKNDIACAILSLPDSIAWLLNIRGADIARTPVMHGFAILNADATVDLFAADGKLPAALRDHLGAAVRIHDPAAFVEDLRARKGRVLVDANSAPAAVIDALKKAKPVFEDDPCILPKATKNAAEIDGARAAHLRDGAAMIEFLAWLDAEAPTGGLSEISVAQKLESFRRATNALQDISFETISGFGPNGAIVHYRVNVETNRPVTSGSLLLVDSGGQYLDGTTDITRTIAIGPPPDGSRKAFTLVLKGMIALSRLRWPDGLAGRDIDALARAALWAHGMDYDHGTGHGVGAYLGVHEGPASISRRSTVPIRAGMILSNEPGYYREGAFGIRIENLVLAQGPDPVEGGDRPMMRFETLTYTPIDRRLIDPKLLTAGERDWLDAYHQRTRELFEDLVSTAAGSWLVKATAPL